MSIASVILILALLSFVVSALKQAQFRLIALGLACITFALLVMLGLRPGG